jgi:5-methylcytosine-specific restriction endonuclease McrA
MQDVLVLNRSYVAVHVVDWMKAITLLVSDKADVIDEEYRKYSFLDWKELSSMMKDNPSGFVRSPSCRIAIPDVIILKIFDRLPSGDVKFTRRNIYKHYSNVCCYCGKKFDTKELNLDHVMPKSRGGKTSWENIVLSCIPCNTNKANKTPHEAKLKMHYDPSKPTWHHSLSGRISSLAHNRLTWQRFIDAIYWNAEIDRD